MKKILGLDLGTTSIGWALVKEAEIAEEKSSIIKLGVRVNPLTVDEQSNFEKGKAITTNADRTLKRTARRNLQRYKLRRENLLSVLKENDYNLSVSTYVEQENTREVVDIKVLNAEIEQIVAREQVLRDEIAKIIAEIEVQ